MKPSRLLECAHPVVQLNGEALLGRRDLPHDTKAAFHVGSRQVHDHMAAIIPLRHAVRPVS